MTNESRQLPAAPQCPRGVQCPGANATQLGSVFIPHCIVRHRTLLFDKVTYECPTCKSSIVYDFKYLTDTWAVDSVEHTGTAEAEKEIRMSGGEFKSEEELNNYVKGGWLFVLGWLAGLILMLFLHRVPSNRPRVFAGILYHPEIHRVYAIAAVSLIVLLAGLVMGDPQEKKDEDDEHGFIFSAIAMSPYAFFLLWLPNLTGYVVAACWWLLSGAWSAALAGIVSIGALGLGGLCYAGYAVYSVITKRSLFNMAQLILALLFIFTTAHFLDHM